MQPNDLAGEKLGAPCYGRVAERVQQAMCIKPAFPGQPKATGGQVRGCEPRETRLQFGRTQQTDIRALPGLDPRVVVENGFPLLARQQQIARLPKANLDIRPQAVFDGPQELYPKLRQVNIHRGRELLPNRG